VFERLLAEFVSGEMVCFCVGDGRSGMGMFGQIVEFRGSIMSTLRH